VAAGTCQGAEGSAVNWQACFLSYVMRYVRRSSVGMQFRAEHINLSCDPFTCIIVTVLISPRTVLRAVWVVSNLSDTLRRRVPSTIVY
jgi:hypothetical protein